MTHRLPPPPRLLPGQRWMNIALRGLHLVGIAGLAGGFLFGLPEAQWAAYAYLAIATGILLSALYLWTDARWLVKLKGQAILAKFVLVILLSAFFAHAPDRVRSHAWGRPLRSCKTAAISRESKP